ncbi:MAG: hypothetical protein JW984_02625 [Deltaproteobacteria bacterium]|uniref:Uncharacterized protein n=1 Tax=Candidatus Zymogenus saltonus TaxID=2844893 RepID=A0A9D8PJF0_9DELT|nr:hypothetical protein [Candidatus Zymogenus saltonus]
MIWHIMTILCGILTVLAALFPESYSHLLAGDFKAMVTFFASSVVLFAALALGSYRDWI